MELIVILLIAGFVWALLYLVPEQTPLRKDVRRARKKFARDYRKEHK